MNIVNYDKIIKMKLIANIINIILNGDIMVVILILKQKIITNINVIYRKCLSIPISPQANFQVQKDKLAE